jgi:hypothetical protein
MDESNSAILFMEKPKPTDAFSIKERFIQSKVSSSVLSLVLSLVSYSQRLLYGQPCIY